MKTILQRSAFVALTFTLLLPLSTFAQGDKEESPLHNEMEGMNRSLRQINRQYTNLTQKASTLELVATMQKHAETARTLTPPKANKLTGDDQTKYLDTFHKDLDAVITEMGLLQQAIVADKTDVAKTEIAKIRQLEESSHKELGVGAGGHKHGGPPPPAPAQ
jgi:hypothetical protein